MVKVMELMQLPKNSYCKLLFSDHTVKQRRQLYSAAVSKVIEQCIGCSVFRMLYSASYSC